MSRQLLLAWMVAAALGSASVPARASEVPMSGDLAASAEVWRTFESWLQAYATGDLQQVMTIFDRAVVFEFQGSKDESFDELRRDYEIDFRTRAPGTAWKPRVEEVRAQGDMAFVRSVWELHVVGQGAGAPGTITQRNRSLDVFCRQDGRWRIIRSINYPEQARQP
jgi:uncharacterized protein (TIGR02246 family)